MPTVTTTKTKPPPKDWDPDSSHFRSWYEVYVDGELRAHIALPQGFGKAWTLRTLGGTERAQIGKKGRRRWGVEDPIAHLTARLLELGLGEFPTQAETEARNAALAAERATQEAAHAASTARRVDEGVRLVTGLLRLAKRLDRTDDEAAEICRTAAERLPGAYPYGVRNATVVKLLEIVREEANRA